MPRASTPRSAREARTAADPLQGKPKPSEQTLAKKLVKPNEPWVRGAMKPFDPKSSLKKWVASPVTEAPTPDKETPWRHPAELEYITPPLSDDEIFDTLMKNGFSVPSRPKASKEPWTKITSWDGETVTTIPRRYRLPLMFAAKFQWQSLKLVMASENRESEWVDYKYDILHVSRLCARFLEEARKAKAQMLLNTEWKCHTFDRAIIRYYQRWMLSRDEFVKEFWYEFDEDEYRKNVFEFNWHKFVLEGHKGFSLTKEEVLNGLSFEDLTEGCGFVDGRVKWGTSSNSTSTTAVPQDNLLGSSTHPPSNGVSGDPVGRLRPRVDKLSLEVKREMLDDSLSISSRSSSLSPAPSSPIVSRGSIDHDLEEDAPNIRIRIPVLSNGDLRSDGRSASPAQASINGHQQVTPPATSPSTLTTVTNTASNATSTDLSSAPSPMPQSANGSPAPDKDVTMTDIVLPTPPPSAPSAPPVLTARSKSSSDDNPSGVVLPEKASTIPPPKRPSPLLVQTTSNGSTDSTSPSPSLGGTVKTPIRSSWDARVKDKLERSRLATSKSSDSTQVSGTTPNLTPSSTPIIPSSVLPPSLTRVTPTMTTSPPPSQLPSIPEPPPHMAESELPPEYDEKELLKTYFEFPDSGIGTPAPHEAPQPNGSSPPAVFYAPTQDEAAGSGEKIGIAERGTSVEEVSSLLSPKSQKPTSPSSFDISSSRESSAERPPSPVKMDISPPPSARVPSDNPSPGQQALSQSMDVDNPLAEKVTTVLKHTVEGLTEFMNSIHHPNQPLRSPSVPGLSSPSVGSGSSSVTREPSLADLMGELRSLKEAIQEESQQKAERDQEMRQLKTEVEELRRMLVRSAGDDSMSVDGDHPVTRMIPSASFYRRSPSTMTPISAHPLSHLLHADDDDEPAPGRSWHQRSASGSTTGGGESASAAMSRVPSRLMQPASPSRTFSGSVPDNVPFKLKKKHMVFPKPPE